MTLNWEERANALFNLSAKIINEAKAVIPAVETALDRDQLATATRILETFNQSISKKEEDFHHAMFD